MSASETHQAASRLDDWFHFVQTSQRAALQGWLRVPPTNTPKDDSARGRRRNDSDNPRSSAGRASAARERPIVSLILRCCQRVVAAVLITLGLAGCGKTETYRYKFTLAVNTPEGVKRGSSVVEIMFWDVSVPANGTMHKLRGEALYLGPWVRHQASARLADQPASSTILEQ